MMNVFYLDENPKICAMHHNDKHCVKMILEYAQLLSTAHRVCDGVKVIIDINNRKNTQYKLADSRDDNIYKAAFVNHPSAIWVRKSKYNYMWLRMLWEDLLDEYHLRYGKYHAAEKLKRFLINHPTNISNDKFTQPTCAMPDDCKISPNALINYRIYYKKHKSHLAKWTARGVPSWYNKGINYDGYKH